MPLWMRRLFALALVLTTCVAGAMAFPADAEVILADEAGVIVGVGRFIDGATFELDLLVGSGGPAVMVVLLADGTTLAIDVEVRPTGIAIDGVDLIDLLVEGGFERAVIRLDGQAIGRVWPPPVPAGAADDRPAAGRGVADDVLEDVGPPADRGPPDDPGPPEDVPPPAGRP